jgi:hypothetical protein
VIAGLTTLIFMGVMLSVHPLAAVALLAGAGALAAIRGVGLAQERRDALAAHADSENRQLLGAPSLKWPVLPIDAQRPRRRPADHRSITEPLKPQ